jgi:hypothetical protein
LSPPRNTFSFVARSSTPIPPRCDSATPVLATLEAMATFVHAEAQAVIKGDGMPLRFAHSRVGCLMVMCDRAREIDPMRCTHVQLNYTATL